MAASLVLGIDCSTTAATCVAWDADGEARATERATFALDNPTAAHWEQDARAWWTATADAIALVTDEVGADAVAGLCVTHQRETFVVADRDGTPRRPAIVWMDERSRPQVQRLRGSDREDAFHTTSGKPVCMTPSVFKVAWLHDETPDVLSGDAVVTDVGGFLLYRMLGRWVTSTASADPMGLLDMGSGDWSDELLELAGLDRNRVPELAAAGSEMGGLTAEAAEALGLAAGTPVFAGAGDGQSAGLGAGIVGPGRAYLNLGTAIVSGVWSPEYRTDRAFRTMGGAAPGSFFLETDLKGGTFTVNWLLDRFLEPDDSDAELRRLSDEAAQLPPGSEGLVLVPYWSGVMNPYWDDDASGVVLGFRGHHGPVHLYRAILEGIAFEQRRHLDAVVGATGEPIDDLVTMGGGTRSELWCQVIADVTGRRVVLSKAEEATALGAGIVAAVGAGLHPDVGTAVDAMTGTGRTFEPGPDQAAYDELYTEVYEGLYPAVRGAMERLTRIAFD